MYNWHYEYPPSHWMDWYCQGAWHHFGEFRAYPQWRWRKRLASGVGLNHWCNLSFSHAIVLHLGRSDVQRETSFPSVPGSQNQNAAYSVLLLFALLPSKTYSNIGDPKSCLYLPDRSQLWFGASILWRAHRRKRPMVPHGLLRCGDNDIRNSESHRIIISSRSIGNHLDCWHLLLDQLRDARSSSFPNL